jgi:hypothetical protein
MRRDRERCEPLRSHTIFVHVSAHECGVQRQERFAADALELPIGRRGERARDFVALDVSHAFHTADGDDIVNPAGDDLVSHAHRGTAGRAGGFDRHGLDSRETRVVCDQPAELLLLREHAR